MDRYDLIMKYEKRLQKENPARIEQLYFEIIRDLTELEQIKVEIPEFVAEWIEKCKSEKKRLLTALLYTPEKVNSWVDDPDNQELFARAWLDGYEVEKEKRYLVKIKGLCRNHETLNREKHSNKWLFSDREENSLYDTKHTRKELEDAGFDWVFDFPGIEIEEVE